MLKKSLLLWKIYLSLIHLAGAFVGLAWGLICASRGIKILEIEIWDSSWRYKTFLSSWLRLRIWYCSHSFNRCSRIWWICISGGLCSNCAIISAMMICLRFGLDDYRLILCASPAVYCGSQSTHADISWCLIIGGRTYNRNIVRFLSRVCNPRCRT